MKQITLKIAANSTEQISVVGDYVRIKTASVPVHIEAMDGQVDARMEQGDALNLKPFQRLSVSHDGAGEQEITLLIGNGTSADSAKVGGSMSISSLPAVTVSALPVAAMVQTAPAVGVASGLLVAANAARKFLMVQNNSASQDVCLNLAGAAATLAGGVKLAPGASLVLDVCCPSAAIYAIADAAGASVVVVEG